MGSESKEDRAFAQGLVYQVELILLQVSNAAVDHSGGTAGGPCREVLLLDQPYAKLPGRGVEGDPAPGDPAPDDQEVELVLGHAFQSRAAGLRGEGKHARIVEVQAPRKRAFVNT
jgi:hypothetical protein